jgi:type IV pilus assembly protein PilW
MGNNGVMTAQELVEGVEDMQITYGEDTDNDRNANLYVDANGVTNWEKVVNVRINLTVRSAVDGITTSVTSAGDWRLRRTFNKSITIRNRVV